MVLFLDNSVSIALEYATHLPPPGKVKNPIKEPAVIGAVSNSGYCLDLLDYQNLQLLKKEYGIIEATYHKSAFPKIKL